MASVTSEAYAAAGTDEHRVHQAIDELPGILALPVSYGIVLRQAIRPIRRTNPAPELCTGRADLGCDGIIGKHRHRVAPLDEPSHGMELRWHIATPIDQREQVLAGSHRVLLKTAAPPGSCAGAANDPVDQFEHDPLGVGAGQLQVAAKELPRVDIRRHVQRVNGLAARGRRLRQEIRKDAIEPCLVTGACAIEQRRQRAKPLGRHRPSCGGIAEPLVLAHQNGDGAWWSPGAALSRTA